MLSIQTNVSSLIAQQNLNVNNAFQANTIQQLTSGYRINQSGDDAAGLAVANGYRDSISQLNQGVANGNDASAQLQIMDGGMSNISQILDRLQTLAVQSASGSFTGSRSTLNDEFQTDLNEINRQAQSIGLNTGGTFASNMAVFLGAGSGSQSQANSIVNVNLSASAVDSQALGLSGMQVVNANSGTGLVNTDIGSTSQTSVEDIVSNTSGDNANQEALSGYASFQFSGAGFNNIGVSVNLTGVSDVATLATAVNQAIAASSNGTSAAADAFKNAGITASVYTDSNGAQALAFSSSTSAFQVQAGDQMANALMGNVSVVGGVAQGVAVNTAAVTGAATTAGSFTSPQNVHLVITGGGLSSAQTLTLNSSDSTTGAAISDLLNQFQGNSDLVAAGLTMTNSAGGGNVGGQLTFNSATGQTFNVQVTGDTQNLLGLGSFLSSNSGTANYSTITAGAAYNASAVTGSLGTTQAQSAGLEISINGAAATALTPIDLTAGANASAASVTGGALNLNGVDIGATNNALNLTVVNNGVVTNWSGTLSGNQETSSGAVASSNITAASSVTVDSTHDQFQLAVNGGPAVQITVVNGTYTGTAGNNLVTALNTAIGQSSLAGTVSAGWDATSGLLTFTSATTGPGSSVALSSSTTTNTVNTAATEASSSLTSASSVTVDANHDKFDLSVDGGPSVQISVTSGTYTGTGDNNLVTALNTAIGQSSLSGTVSAGWDATSGLLTFTSTATGAAASVAVSSSTTTNTVNTAASVASSTVNAASSVTVDATHDKFNIAVGGSPAVQISVADGTYTGTGASSLVTAINTAIGQAGLGGVSAGWNAVTGMLTFTSTATGAGATVTLSSSSTTNTVNTAASVASSDITSATTVTVDATHNTFQIAVDGGASVAVTVQAGTYTGTGDSDLTAAINAAIGQTSLAGTVTAGWDANTGLLTFTSGTSGAGSSVAVSNGATNDMLTTTAGQALDFTNGQSDQGSTTQVSNDLLAQTPGQELGITNGTHDQGTTNQVSNDLLDQTAGQELYITSGVSDQGSTTQVSNDLLNQTAGKELGIVSGSHNSGLADQPSTLASIASQLQNALGAAAVVSVSNTGKLTIASATKGANSEVLVNTPGANSANATLGLTGGTGLQTTAGQNSSINDIVANLNAQFAANQVYQAAGLTAAATNSTGSGVGNYITISSSNGTQFRLNALGGGSTTAENVGFGTAGTSFSSSAQHTAASVLSSSINQNSSVTVDATHNTFQIAVNGGNAVAVTVAAGTYSGAALLTALNNAIGQTALTGTVSAGWDAATGDLKFTTTATGSTANIALTNGASNDLLSTTGGKDLGFATGASGQGKTIAGAVPTATTAMSTLQAYGTSATGAQAFAALQYGNEKQVLTFSANNSTGGLETKSITLQNNASSSSGASIDNAVAYINQQLQAATTDPALQSIVAVKENVNGQEKINFVSSLTGFTVGVGGTGSTDGVDGGAPATLQGSAYGSAANASIATQSGAEAAVTAITSAVAKLGAAQAAVGIGENQLTFAVNLAQSQITNFSAAESQIRDADIAQEAANLSKAQVLQQSTIAAMAQANTAPQAVLSLLKT